MSQQLLHAIDANFDERGHWNGLGTDIFSGGNQRWKPKLYSLKKKTKKVGLKATFKIPARPYITLTPEDLQEIIQVIQSFI